MDQTTLIGVPKTRITTPAELAAAGYLARYSGSTRQTYRVSLKLLWGWCAGLGVDPLEGMRRPVLEMFARYLEEERHNSPATVAHHLSIIRGFYSFAEIDGYIDRSPAAHLRMPRVYIDESRTLGLDRMELGSLIQTARASCPSDAALITLMGMLGLRVSEACAVQIEDYQDIERGHRVLLSCKLSSISACRPCSLGAPCFSVLFALCLYTELTGISGLYSGRFLTFRPCSAGPFPLSLPIPQRERGARRAGACLVRTKIKNLGSFKASCDDTASVSRSSSVGCWEAASKAQGITPGQWRHVRTDLVIHPWWWSHGRSWHSFACAAFGSLYGPCPCARKGTGSDPVSSP